MGFNFIKKLMWKDGHMVDDNQYYLRAKDGTKGTKGIFCFWDGQFAVRQINQDFNKGQYHTDLMMETMRKETIVADASNAEGKTPNTDV